MLKSIVVALAALFMLGGAAAPGGGGGHGGGGARGGVVVGVYVPGRYSPYTGLPASINLSYASPAGSNAGVLALGAVLGARIASADEAIVLNEGVNEKGVEIAPGTVPVRMSLSSVTTDVWCSVRQMPELHSPTTDCLGGTSSTGRLDRYWRAYLFNKAAPFTIIGLSSVQNVAPVSYRPAKPEEVPTVETGYAYCPMDGAGVALPHFFVQPDDQDEQRSVDAGRLCLPVW